VTAGWPRCPGELVRMWHATACLQTTPVAALLDGHGDEDEPAAGVRNQEGDPASNLASYRPGDAESVTDGCEP